MKKSILTILCLLVIFVLPCSARTLTLAGKGIAPAAITVEKTSSPVLAHAAEELAHYLGKITDTVLPAGGGEVKNARCRIFLMTAQKALQQKILPDKEIKKLKEDGFFLHTAGRDLYIIGSTPLGVLYGSYEVVKRYGGICFLFPGKEGEYYKKLDKICIPAGTFLYNPAFPYRTVFLGRSYNNYFMKDTWDWEVRNNLKVRTTSMRFSKKSYDHLAKVNGYCSHGGHVFTQLLVSPLYNNDLTVKELFRKHPEVFPLINGKRTMLEGQKYQPCTSNSKTLERMRRGILHYVERRMKKGDIMIIGNNDSSSWCQCENCLKLDPPEERKNNSVATRYWLLVNDLANTVWKKYPGMRLGGWAYQNFQKVPKGVSPHPDLTIILAWNNLCFRHGFAEKDCPVNQEFYRSAKEWKKLKNPVAVWEETTFAAADCYLPITKKFLETLSSYRKLKIDGPLLLASAPEAKYPAHYQNTRTPISWYAMWSFMYLSSRYLWEGKLDMEKEFRKICSLYYGKAGKHMLEYHKLLEKAFLNVPICYGWSHNAPIGRCLELPGTEEKALQKLMQAKMAVKDDPAALKHVEIEEKFFREVWILERKNYLAGFRELKSLPREGKIVIDGADQEKDWKNAERVTSFKKMRTSIREAMKNASMQTFCRVVYEPEYLYFYIEAMETNMGEMKGSYTHRDSALWNDNNIEIFINHPNINKRYFHYIFNHNGALYDAFCDGVNRAGDRSYDSGLQAKIKKLKDRWCLEVKIPTAELGFQCFPGSSWKINIARSRILKNGYKEHSSISNGFFHNVNNFLPLLFTKKAVGAGGRYIDGSPWRNGSFETIVPYGKGKRKNWKIKGNNGPLFWSLLGNTGEMEVYQDPATNFSCLKLSSGGIYQFYQGKISACQIRFKFSGKGILNVRLLRQKLLDGNKRKGLPTKTLKKIHVDSSNWQEHVIHYTACSDEIIAPVFECLKGKVALDDVMIVPENSTTKGKGKIE